MDRHYPYMPKLEFRSNAKPSQFAYPPPLEDKKEKTKEKVLTAVLSITAKQKKKEAEKKKDEEKMDVDDEKKDKEEEKMETEEGEKEKQDKEKTEKEKEPEPNFQMLDNPARVMKAQLKVLLMPETSRYVPVKDVTHGGIIMMRNSKPGEQEEIIEPVAAGGPKIEEEEEPEPPEPFEWTED
ncbi:26S proteasome non-ATPase regulatory subunit 1-like [Saccostrea cucullata]|uniref:26S proteasome non-ATPase regulatory subunit 1-like n=1 Tax=Saccostrea cuccullata TaxID=36930 RepID=UPI002ED5928E